MNPYTNPSEALRRAGKHPSGDSMSLALAIIGVVLVLFGAVALVHTSYIAGAILVVAGLVIFGSRNGVTL